VLRLVSLPLAGLKLRAVHDEIAATDVLSEQRLTTPD
jgi:hypothetical protein